MFWYLERREITVDANQHTFVILFIAKKPECSSDYEDETEKWSKISITRCRRSARNRKLSPLREPEMIELSSDSETETPMKHHQIQEEEEETELPPGEVMFVLVDGIRCCYFMSRTFD